MVVVECASPWIEYLNYRGKWVKVEIGGKLSIDLI